MTPPPKLGDPRRAPLRRQLHGRAGDGAGGAGRLVALPLLHPADVLGPGPAADGGGGPQGG